MPCGDAGTRTARSVIDTVDVEHDLVQFRTRRRGWPSSCNVYLLRDGDGAVLVDAGLGVEPDLAALMTAVTAALARWERPLAALHTILLTHTHTDHAGGAIPIARATGARVLLPARGFAQASDPDWQVHHILPEEVRRELPALRDFDVAAHFREETMPELFAAQAGVAWQLTEDGDELVIGRHRLRAFHLPGHDVGHLAWVDLVSGLAFTGDLLTARGTSLPWYPPNAGGVRGYLDSLATLAALPLELVCPGHHAVHRGAEAIAALRRDTVRMVHERDRRLLAALAAGPATFAQLDDLVYEAAVRQVIPWASSVTVAHLRHLEEAGVVLRRGDGCYVADAAAARHHLRNLDGAAPARSG